MLEKLLILDLSPSRTKEDVIADINNVIDDNGYKVVDTNLTKPWGAFWRFDSNEATRFIEDFFPGLTREEAEYGIKGAELSPKFLLVAPDSRLSWQYHYRRAERWRNIAGLAGYYKSHNDRMGEVNSLPVGSVVQFDCGERHRLTNGNSWSLVAEIWQHVDSKNPSDEDDIVRVSDDYNR